MTRGLTIPPGARYCPWIGGFNSIEHHCKRVATWKSGKSSKSKKKSSRQYDDPQSTALDTQATQRPTQENSSNMMPLYFLAISTCSLYAWLRINHLSESTTFFVHLLFCIYGSCLPKKGCTLTWLCGDHGSNRNWTRGSTHRVVDETGHFHAFPAGGIGKKPPKSAGTGVTCDPTYRSLATLPP